MSRAWVDLARHGAGHQADPLSTDRRDALQRSSVEDSSESSTVERGAWHRSVIRDGGRDDIG